MARCKACGAQILFIKTAKGKLMPCDNGARYYWPDDEGRVLITSAGETVRGTFEREPGVNPRIGFVPHWASCPAAQQFKKKDRATIEEERV